MDIEDIKYLAEREDALASFIFGFLLENGIAIEKDTERAIKYYTIASNNDITLADYALGDLLYVHRKNDLQLSLQANLKAVDKKYPPAIFSLGLTYELGECVKKDDKKAFEFIKNAADENYLPAMNAAGCMLRDGVGTNNDDSEAFKLFLKAAELGNTNAAIFLADMYANGRGTTKNNETALFWLESSAKKDNPDAYDMLSMAYRFEMYGVERDPKKADEMTNVANKIRGEKA
jgi:TPR repeat protein